MTSIRLERREPARNRQRFYAITVTRTLFGRWALVREWGRIGQAGTVRETGFATETAAIAASAAVRQQGETRLSSRRQIQQGGGQGGRMRREHP
jgi:predicted DNA-binding WGR domain protein